MTEDTYFLALRKARKNFRSLELSGILRNSGTECSKKDPNKGEITLSFLNKDYIVSYPDATVIDVTRDQVPVSTIQILLLHYLITADGTPLANNWVPYSKLSGGRAFIVAFQREAIQPLAKAFGNDEEAFRRSCENFGGEELEYGDLSFKFRVFPCQWVAVILHLSTEGFPPSANILFDESANHYLHTEDWAGVGSLLSRRLIGKRSNEKRY